MGLMLIGCWIVKSLEGIDYYGFFRNYHFLFVYTFFGRCFEFFCGIGLALFFKNKLANETRDRKAVLLILVYHKFKFTSVIIILFRKNSWIVQILESFRIQVGEQHYFRKKQELWVSAVIGSLVDWNKALA